MSLISMSGGAGQTYTQQFHDLGDGSVLPVTNSVQKKWRTDFSTAAALPAKWDISRTGTGMTYSVANGMLSVNMGTTLDDSLTFLGKELFTIPCRAMVALNMSQRVAGQTVFIELVSVDPVTGEPDEQGVAAWRLDGTSATAGIYEVATGGMPRTMSPAAAINTTAPGTANAFSGLEVQACSDEAWFHARVVDRAEARSQSYVRHSQIPDPNRLYRLRLRLANRQVVDNVTAVTSAVGVPVSITRAGHGLANGDTITLRNLAGFAGIGDVWVGQIEYVTTSVFRLVGTEAVTGTWINNGWMTFTKDVGPASSTTVNFNFCTVTDYAELTAEITSGQGSASAGQAISTQVTNAVSVVSGGADNLSGGTSFPTGIYRNAALGTVSTGRSATHTVTMAGALVQKPYAIPELDWSYCSPISGLAAGADTVVKAAAGALIRNYVTAIQIVNAGGTATEVQIKDGATVMWRMPLAANSQPFSAPLPSPLRGSPNTALTILAVTSGSAVVVNVQGYAGQ